MADGKTHEVYLRKLWPVILLLSIVIGLIGRNLLYTVFLILNFSICDILDPDADQLGLTKSEGDALRTAKRLRIGFIGALWIAWWFLYAYIIGVYGRKKEEIPWKFKGGVARIVIFIYRNTVGLFRGHRSPASHSLVLGTIIRMIWFNIPLFVLFVFLEYYGLRHWWKNDYPYFMSAVHWNLSMNMWLIPYIVTQFISWTIGDAVHLWADDMLNVPERWRFKGA